METADFRFVSDPGTFFVAICRKPWYYADGAAITVGGQPLPAMGGGTDDYNRSFTALSCTYQFCEFDRSDKQKELTAQLPKSCGQFFDPA